MEVFKNYMLGPLNMLLLLLPLPEQDVTSEDGREELSHSPMERQTPDSGHQWKDGRG